MNYSFWEKYFIESPVDITIIGSGIVGLSTAISIKESRPELSIKIIERGSLPYGASTKNAGFSCFGSVSELLDDIKNMGEGQCMEVVNMRWKGLKKLRSRIGDAAMAYTHCGGTELFRPEDEDLKQLCLSQIEYCNELMSHHISIDQCYSVKSNDTVLSFEKQSIFNAFEGSINPVMMMNELIKKAISLGIHIINGLTIKEIDKTNKQLIGSENIRIAFKKLIVCTNGFASQLLPNLPVTAARNQVLITSPLDNVKLDSCYHVDKGYIYFRPFEGRILIGGGRNYDAVTEATSEFGNTKVIQEYLLSILEKIHPGASKKVDHWWSGILGIGHTKFPICEWVDKDILVGVRLGGMGIAIGSYLGEQLAEMAVSKM
ncbi:MAG: FAD-binding oxidoreductase [Saprospiraceae bacterium]|nr:FAD-binding oxidoreductase [Saprospiraceae bacterium]